MPQRQIYAVLSHPPLGRNGKCRNGKKKLVRKLGTKGGVTLSKFLIRCQLVPGDCQPMTSCVEAVAELFRHLPFRPRGGCDRTAYDHFVRQTWLVLYRGFDHFWCMKSKIYRRLDQFWWTKSKIYLPYHCLGQTWLVLYRGWVWPIRMCEI